MKLVTILMVSLLCMQAPAIAQVALEDFLFTAAELPTGCTAKQIQENDRLPCDITANPFVGEDRAFLDCFARSFTRDAAATQKIQRGLFSVYEAGAEVGVFGIATDTPETATTIFTAMQERLKGDSNSGRLFKTKNLLLWVWHDREKTAMYEEILQLVESRIAH